MRLAKAARVLTVAALAVGSALLPVTAAGGPAAADTGSASAFSATKTVTRTYLDADGKSSVVAQKTVKVHVSQTKNLYGRQNIDVGWSGAMPTAGLQPYLNRANADQQEYPMVLLECRGTPAKVSQQTCWTHGADQRYQGISYTSYGPWRLDRYASAADRAAVVGRPKSADKDCGSAASNEHWEPFQAIGGKRYYYGNQSCAGLPPEDYNSDQSAQIVPQNTTFAPTGTDGTGSWKFDVWTDQENASLGCSATVACTLEVIPVMGISCDPYGKAGNVPSGDVPGPDDSDRATSLCETNGNYQPGAQANASTGVALSVSGALWWSESNWRNRIAVPLTFAPVSNACSQTGGGAPVSVYGSEVMAEATTQWAPKFCLDPKLFKLTHVQTAEPLAQSLLSDPGSGVKAAFASLPPTTPFPQPTVQAPVGVTGFSISYNIDNDHGDAVTNVRLTPRLLAKLLTESYTGEDFNRFATGQYKYLGSNPYNITKDPEFQALNPDISSEFGNAGPATLIALSAESDVTYAVTSYINADPQARAWLNGKPDPWGMVVNKNYKNIALPLLRWPLLDTTQPNFGQNVPCTSIDPAPWLPLVASPTPTLASTSLDVQFASSPGKVACTTVGDPGPNQLVQWTSAGSQAPGQRFVIGITSLGEATRYDLASAALQSSGTETNDTKDDVTTGRTFVTASPKSLATAAALLRDDPATKTWSVGAATLRGHSDAYPGLLVVNADVPTTGLSKSIANDYANLLDFAAGPGQTAGTNYGQLPAGYLPMTKANGLAGLAANTRQAAIAVRQQNGGVPLSTGKPDDASPSVQQSGADGAQGGAGGGAYGNGAGGVGGTAGGTTANTGGRNGTTGNPATSDNQVAVASVSTPNTGLGASGVLLPVILGVAALGGLLAGGATYRRRTNG